MPKPTVIAISECTLQFRQHTHTERDAEREREKKKVKRKKEEKLVTPLPPPLPFCTLRRTLIDRDFVISRDSRCSTSTRTQPLRSDLSTKLNVLPTSKNLIPQETVHRKSNSALRNPLQLITDRLWILRERISTFI